MRVVAHGAIWCRPQPVTKKSVPATAENGPSIFETRFWLFGGGVVFLWISVRVFDFTLLPPAYHGLLITQPFCGLHSWDLADRAWAARSHLKYGLGYTRGLRTLVVGDPPPLIPEYYVSHPPLETWILALGMLVFGTQDWSVRLFELAFSVPCLLLILRLLRKLHGSACALLSGLILVLLPYSGYFGFNPLMVLLALWALHRYLLLTGRLADRPAAQPCHLLELAIALFLVVQFNWVGIFYAFVMGLHSVLTCWRQRRVQWKVLATLALPSLLSLGLNFYIMIWGMQHNIGVESPSPDSVLFASSKQDTPWARMAALFQQPARTGKHGSSRWTDWGQQNLEYAQANFTAPVLVFLAAYLLYLLIARLHVLEHRLVAPVQATAQAGLSEVPYRFQHFWFYLLPGLLFLFTFKGLVWRHQYWQSPFALFVAIGSALALLSVGDVFGRIHRWFGRSVVIALVLVVAAFCDQGLASYRTIGRPSSRTISLFKELNRRIPPNKGLLSFKDFLAEPNEADTTSHRQVYAWYVDRGMVVANAWKYGYYPALGARIDEVVAETVREVQGQAETGLFWYYFIPACEEYRHDPLREEQQIRRMFPIADLALFAKHSQPETPGGTYAANQMGVASLAVEELDRRLRDNDPRDDTILIWEKHRRYREAVIARLKELYHYEYYGNTAQPGDEDFCYSGITPCYLFDLLRPK
jgi:4-amino-4-deoxy-L-arabinose transferase-like glycosyltransferase